MKKLSDFREEYEKIEASEELKNMIRKTINEEKRKKSSFKKYVAVAACAIGMAVVGLNLSPSIAYASADIPIWGEIVKIVTFGRYTADENGYQANIATPKIEGLLDKALEEKLNKEFQDNAATLISAFESDVMELKAEFGEELVHMGIDYDYMIKTDTEEILALDVYMVNTAGSSSTVHSFYTIDKKTGEIVTLEGLFKKDAEYVSIISKYLLGEMQRMNKEEASMFWVDETDIPEDKFIEIKADQNFYINTDGDLVVCFDKYEVAAGAQGSPEFVIPESIIEGIKK